MLPLEEKKLLEKASSDSTLSTKEESTTTTTTTTAADVPSDDCLPGNAALRAFLDKLTADTCIAKWIELPMICVMGDTSSGKSSLLTNLSGIELPSSHQLTTRCPVLLHMKRSPRKLARVGVQWASPPPLSSSRDGEPAEFEERVLSETEWDDIARTVLEAQRHVLSRTGRDVAPDAVTLHVQAPFCTDLTLLDLPGLVRSTAKDESATLVQDVELLVQEYLSNTRCVILAVQPANVDFHNSQITASARKVDPATVRTIPVITKPDLVDAGAERDVLDLLLGNKQDFSLGFHMIKNRGQAALDRRQAVADGLREEQRFFDTTEPWKSVADRSLFGTVHLRRKLGDLQMSMIRRSVPGILQEIRDRKQHAESVLREMGDFHQTMQDRRRYYQDLCQTVVSQIKSSLSGKGCSSRRPSAAATLHENCSQFMDRIKQGSLCTIKTIQEGGHVLVTSARGSVRGEVVHLDESFACVDYVDEDDANSEALFDLVGMQSNEPVEENDVWSDGTKVYIARKNNVYDSLRKIPFSSIRTDPAWLKEKISGHRTDDLACFLNADIFKNIVEEFIEDEWKPHAIALLNQTREILLSTIEESVERSFPSDRYPALRALMIKRCRETSDKLMKKAHEQVKSHFEVEKYPYTQDDELLENIATARQRVLKRELEVALRLDQEGVYDTGAIQTLIDSVFERNRRKSPEDHMAEEMECVLESYGNIATRRVVDRTPMIAWEIFRTLAKSIEESLWNVTDDTLVQYMQESPAFTEKYKATAEELAEMNKALELFETIA
jgi:interferon-induced GTP-binding protein Mx1